MVRQRPAKPSFGKRRREFESPSLRNMERLADSWRRHPPGKRTSESLAGSTPVLSANLLEGTAGMAGNRPRKPGACNSAGFDSSTFRQFCRESRMVDVWVSRPIRMRQFESGYNTCRCSSMVEYHVANVGIRVRFPVSAPIVLTVQGLVGEASGFQSEERGSIPRARSNVNSG